MIQSFDWRTIRAGRAARPAIDTVALVWQFAGADCDALDDECSLEAVMGDPSVNQPLDGRPRLVGLRGPRHARARRRRRRRLEQLAGPRPVAGHVDSADYYLKEDPAMYHGPPVAGLQARGLRVVPYTINDEPTMQRVIELGVDGIISDDPDRAPAGGEAQRPGIGLRVRRALPAPVAARAGRGAPAAGSAKHRARRSPAAAPRPSVSEVESPAFGPAARRCPRQSTRRRSPSR